MIRVATVSDRERIVEMGARFVAESQYGGFFRMSEQAVSATVERVLDSDDGTILVLDMGGSLVGMIVMVIYTHPFSGDRVASELAWWVDSGSRASGGGVRLLRAAETWARDRDASAIQMIAPNVQVGNLYGKLGYRPMETAFQRSL